MNYRYKFTAEFFIGDALVHKEVNSDRIQDFKELKAVVEMFERKYPGAQIDSCKLEDLGTPIK